METFIAELPRLTCTEGTRVCPLLSHLTACNEALCLVGLQLREDARDEPVSSSVMTVSTIRREIPPCTKCTRKEKAALELLKWLFKWHCCIVSLEANYGVVNSSGLVEVLARSSSLRRLTIFGNAKDPPGVAEPPADPEFPFLHGYIARTAGMEIAARLLEMDGARLVSLDVTELEMSPSAAKKLIDALLKNGTIEELAVGASVITCGAVGGTLGWFLLFLIKRDATVRKLVLRSPLFKFDIAGLHTLAQAICIVTTLEDLTLEIGASSQHCALFLKSIAQSRSVRSLTFLPGRIEDGVIKRRQRENSGDPSWVSALQENRTLQKLDLDVSWSSSGDCCLLIKELVNDRNLQSVTLRNFPSEDVLQEVCRTIRECGVEERVLIEDHSAFAEEESCGRA
ncbi:hypothetical protein HPB50_005275 [Hyalomma asiaticum]|uniref:Uncharacterized protein n=1 Tax=Hyalomma asiaticum TaxID=266040 RepID=A0ACB7T3J3_HYAAI|nr:hypothetical protein HPB50_005275 [Hyalomma asiaticum]